RLSICNYRKTNKASYRFSILNFCNALKRRKGPMKPQLHKGMRLVAATHNSGKVREIAALLEDRFEVVSAGALGLPEPDETESTCAGNAMLKARHAADASGLPALADDSGLSVAALDGAPG